MIDLTVVIPIRNESPSLVELHRELTETLRAWAATPRFADATGEASV